MTEDRTVEGGLAEPEELEPEQGTLDLAAPEDRHDRAEWEAAAAAVLRKARRLGEDDPDDLVWERLTRTTLDGIGVTPLGTPEQLEGLVSAGRPTRLAEWDIRAHLRVGDAKADNQTLLTDLEGGVSSLWLEADEDTRWATLLDGVLLDLAPVVLQTTEAGARSFLEYAARPSTCTRRPISASRPAPPPASSPSWPGRPACGSSSSTRPRSTTAARPTSRSSPTRWPSGRRTCAP